MKSHEEEEDDGRALILARRIRDELQEVLDRHGASIFFSHDGVDHPGRLWANGEEIALLDHEGTALVVRELRDEPQYPEGTLRRVTVWVSDAGSVYEAEVNIPADTPEGEIEEVASKAWAEKLTAGGSDPTRAYAFDVSHVGGLICSDCTEEIQEGTQCVHDPEHVRHELCCAPGTTQCEECGAAFDEGVNGQCTACRLCFKCCAENPACTAGDKAG